MQDKLAPPLMVDSFEPEQILPMLRQSIPAIVSDLNLSGFADYMFNCMDGHCVQCERKQNGELLGNLDRVEGQLKKQYPKAQENILIIEGFIIPAPHGCYTLKMSKDRKLTFVDREYKGVNYLGLYSWLYQLDKSGITHYFTPDLVGTSILLEALYKNSLRGNHSTLQRYIKPKIYLEEENPYVRSLMGLSGVNLGEKRAKALIDRFGTFWNVIVQDVDSLCEVEGIGRTIATSLLKAVGRMV